MPSVVTFSLFDLRNHLLSPNISQRAIFGLLVLSWSKGLSSVVFVTAYRFFLNFFYYCCFQLFLFVIVFPPFLFFFSSFLLLLYSDSVCMFWMKRKKKKKIHKPFAGLSYQLDLMTNFFFSF